MKTRTRTFWALLDIDGEVQIETNAVIVGQPIDMGNGRAQIYSTKEQAEAAKFEEEKIARVTVTIQPAKRKGSKR